jgi:outer membrane lipoprotein SlyB
MKITQIVLTSFFVLLAGLAHAQDYSGMKYNGNSAQSMQSVTQGRIEDMRQVAVDGSSQLSQFSGAGIGGVLGGILGSTIGNNATTRTAATVALGAIGAVGGNYAAQAINRESAYEYIIKLDDGRVVAVTQSYDSANNIVIGDKVRIIQGDRVRVAKMF